MLKGRLEDDRMLTGRGKYVSDWNLPNQTYGVFLRSDRAHADIIALDAAAALAHAGVIAVITGEDIRAALKSLPWAYPQTARTIKLEVDITRLNCNHMEPLACPAHWDSISQIHHHYTSTQGAVIMMNQLSTMPGVPPEQIRVIAKEVGDGFGVRFNV